MIDEDVTRKSELSYRICQALINRPALTTKILAFAAMQEENTSIEYLTCLDSLDKCGILECHLDEEEEWVYSLSTVWKERLTKSCSCGG